MLGKSMLGHSLRRSLTPITTIRARALAFFFDSADWCTNIFRLDCRAELPSVWSLITEKLGHSCDSFYKIYHLLESLHRWKFSNFRLASLIKNQASAFNASTKLRVVSGAPLLFHFVFVWIHSLQFEPWWISSAGSDAGLCEFNYSSPQIAQAAAARSRNFYIVEIVYARRFFILDLTRQFASLSRRTTENHPLFSLNLDNHGNRRLFDNQTRRGGK